MSVEWRTMPLTMDEVRLVEQHRATEAMRSDPRVRGAFLAELEGMLRTLEKAESIADAYERISDRIHTLRNIAAQQEAIQR